jgi:ribosomal protein S18 acetylase RimI-like enzyme
MAWTAYSAETHALFGRIILDSYQNSLDCPALNGRRDIDDIIAGHQASGNFDPKLWFLLREGDTPLGVLLLSESLRSDSIELVYLGLTPAARGRKLGELMMRQAYATVSARNQPRLCLAVDSKNTPALKLYYRHGMHRIASKLALLRDLRKNH